MNKFILLLPLLILLGCSSLRKECEQQNWFQIAHDTAMKGWRMEQNPMYKKCQKAEAEMNDGEINRGFKLGMEDYCKADGALSAGRNGETFNYDFCEANLHSMLKKQHKNGMDIFCKPESAVEFASKGGIYQSQCTERNEANYLKHYKKGRRSFLKTDILKNENEILSLDREIYNLRSSIARKQQELYLLQQRRPIVPLQKNQRPFPNKNEQANQAAQDAQRRYQDDLDDIQRDIQQLDYRIAAKTNEQKELRTKNIELQAEMDRLAEL